jgi:hypothetical protein
MEGHLGMLIVTRRGDGYRYAPPILRARYLRRLLEGVAMKTLYATVILGLLSLTPAKGDDLPGLVVVDRHSHELVLDIEAADTMARVCGLSDACSDDFLHFRYLLASVWARQILLDSLPRDDGNKARLSQLRSEADDLSRRLDAFRNVIHQRYQQH